MRPILLFLILFCGLLFAPLRLGAKLQAADYDNSQLDEQTLRNASLAHDGAALLEFFRKRSLNEFDRDKLATLVRQLGDKAPEVRDKAMGEIISLGSVAVPQLRQATKDPDEQEIATRAQRCLQLIEGQAGPTIPAAAARLLAQRAPDGAAEVLLAYLPFSDDDNVIEEIKSALAALAIRNGKPDAAVVKALEDKLPIRRAIAAEALCQARGGEAVSSVIALLQDPKPAVRLRAAIALANFREAKAVTTLVALLGELPQPQAKQAEDYLLNLAADLAPKAPLGTDEASRKKCGEAWTAWWQATEGEGSLTEFRKRTMTDADRAKIVNLIRKLGDNGFDVREKASTDLVALGTAAIPFLRQAVQDADLEIVDRARKALARIDKEKPTALSPAAARLVALRKPKGATEAMLAFLPFADDDTMIAEVQSALLAVGVSQGKADAALLRGLEDPVAIRRIAAAEALCQAGVVEQRPTVRKLLEDAEPAVRVRVALALANSRDREAVPALIALVGTLPLEQGSLADEYLRGLAGDKSPNVSLSSDKAAREKCSAAWAAWWREHGDKVDLAAAQAAPRLLGFTLIVNYEMGQIVEVDAQGKQRWQLNGLQYPFDAQVVPGDRVLVAEWSGGRVSERNFKGDILWEKRVTNPISGHRLANGNTFIVTRGQLIEVDRAGKEVFTHNRPNQDIMAAQKLRDGQIIYVTQQGLCIRMDSSGKELKSFQAGGVTYGGLDIPSKGRILIAQINNNKVVEYDLDGKVVWEVTAQQPTSAVRLPNGNTLIASYNANLVYEVDRAGKTVWEVKNVTSRPWRARRR